MIGIVDFGMGNLMSVFNAIERLHQKCKIINTPKQVLNCEKLILPGVGAFGIAIKNLNERGFSDTIKEAVITNKKPILGICLGMQLLYDLSQEFGEHNGLGLVAGSVLSLKEKVKDRPVPHMGWNKIIVSNKSKLLSEESDLIFYFVHSYYCDTTDRKHITGKTEYGISFDAVVEMENIFGCQFHPEKSQKTGLLFLQKFCELNG